MKVIDLLNMRSEKKELPKEIIVKNTLGNYKFKNVSKLCYVDEEGDYLFSDDYNWFDMLDYEVEIIEEPKEELEELEEIELIDIHYVNDKCIFKVNGQSVDETIAIKVNELIANQNKIIRELKDKK